VVTRSWSVSPGCPKEEWQVTERQGRGPSVDAGLREALITRAVAACERGDYEAAIAGLTSALSTAAPNPGLLQRRGLALEAAGRCEEAIDDYTRALRMAGADRGELLYRRGRCHLVLGRIEDATCDLKAHLAVGTSPYEKEICDLLGVRPYQNAVPARVLRER
jgi:tetratricopeptide (TPR) repeat protein